MEKCVYRGLLRSQNENYADCRSPTSVYSKCRLDKEKDCESYEMEETE
jgi:hypothetical protein